MVYPSEHSYITRTPTRTYTHSQAHTTTFVRISTEST